MKNDTNSRTTNESIAYALGVVETRLSEIARDFNQPEQEFRQWVGILLLTQRQGLINNLSSLSGATAKVGKAMGEMEMDEQPYRKTRRPYTSRKVKDQRFSGGSGPSNRKGYNYGGKHWTQLPENKARLHAMAKANSKVRLANARKKVA